MILSMKYWQKVICKDTGDTAGLLCLECFENTKKFLLEGEYIDMDNIRENFLMQCTSCQKLVGSDYSVCGECGEIYPKGMESRVDNGMKCLCCAYGV